MKKSINLTVHDVKKISHLVNIRRNEIEFVRNWVVEDLFRRFVDLVSVVG